uniref:IS630 family transposase n=1 Tax=Heterorhabditis bacteriophora TaxID=37862 RepID=A0A1I7X229_HETBA
MEQVFRRLEGKCPDIRIIITYKSIKCFN